MDLRDLVKLAGIVNPELLNRIETTAEVEEAEGAGFEQATTAPDEQMMDDPMQSMGSDVDTSLRRYLKAKGDHVSVDETVYPDHTVESVSEAYASFKEGSAEDEKAIRRAFDKADEPERGEKRKKVSLKKAPWEKDDDDIEETMTPTDSEWSKLLQIPNKKSWEKMVKSSKDVPGKNIDEADIDENAFNQAAAAASRAGKDSFEFGGKTHKTTMKKDVAHKLDDDVNDELAVLRRNAGI